MPEAHAPTSHMMTPMAQPVRCRAQQDSHQPGRGIPGLKPAGRGVTPSPPGGSTRCCVPPSQVSQHGWRRAAPDSPCLPLAGGVFQGLPCTQVLSFCPFFRSRPISTGTEQFHQGQDGAAHRMLPDRMAGLTPWAKRAAKECSALLSPHSKPGRGSK